MKAGAVAVVALCCGVLSGAARAEPVLANLSVVFEEGTLSASCRLEGALSQSLIEEIDAGLESAIDYRFHLYRRRGGWLDELMQKRRVTLAVRRDTLTRQFTLTRRLDGELVETRVTDDAGVMRDFLTRLRDVPFVVGDGFPGGAEYYVKAKSELGIMWRFYMIPWPLNTGWERAPVPASGKALAREH